MFFLQTTTFQNTKEKCRKFLANLLDLSSREPKEVENNVQTLIQELIDATVQPEDFCDRLERLLNASPQPCLIGFLKVSFSLFYILKPAKNQMMFNLSFFFLLFVKTEKFTITSTIIGYKRIVDCWYTTATT